VLAVTVPAIAAPNQVTVTSSSSGLSIDAAGSTNGTITGQSGNSQNSGFCGWIGSTANHRLTISSSGIVSLKLTVTEPSGTVSKPFTLLIKNAKDSSAAPFCAIADPFSGIPAQIGGVWNSGDYDVFIGDFEGNSNAYILKISQQ
jgi:hypothetical protein